MLRPLGLCWLKRQVQERPGQAAFALGMGGDPVRVPWPPAFLVRTPLPGQQCPQELDLRKPATHVWGEMRQVRCWVFSLYYICYFLMA